jgi:endonuclease/exonuclease/phosphatase family metal-dependent hydrolase
MKLISLNAWGATQGKTFFDFVEEQAKDTDIFCLQEIFSSTSEAPRISGGGYMHLFQELEKILGDFEGMFSEKSSGFDFQGPVNFPIKHGNAVFIRKNIKRISYEDINLRPSASVDADPVEGDIKIQVINLEANGKNFSVINYHGPAVPGNKLDNEERINISKKLKDIWKNLPNSAKILCGDFNLMPETKSIKLLENAGSKNLIKEFKIINTRNEVSWKIYPNKQHFADYTFVSSGVYVKNFEVPYNLVSDHLPMILEFNI